MKNNGEYEIFLRAFEPDDYILINKWRNDRDVTKLTGGVQRYVSSEMEKQWVHEKMLNNTADIYLAVCLNDSTKQMIGYTSLGHIDYVNRSIMGTGTVIGDRQYRDGISLIEVYLLIMSYVFDTLNMNRLSASCLEEHVVASSYLKIMLFNKEGLERQAIYKQGAYHDKELYAILRDDYYQYVTNGQYELKNIIRRFKSLSNNKK